MGGKTKFCVIPEGSLSPDEGRKDNATSITVVNSIW